MWCISTKDAVQPSRFYFLWRMRIIKMINVLNLPCFVPQAPNTKPCWRLGVGTAPSNPSPGPGWRASWLHPLKQTRACRTRHSTVKPATCTSIQRRSSSRWAPNLIRLSLWKWKRSMMRHGFQLNNVKISLDYRFYLWDFIYNVILMLSLYWKILRFLRFSEILFTILLK